MTSVRQSYVLILISALAVLTGCGTVDLSNSSSRLVERTAEKLARTCEKPPGETTVDSRTRKYRTIIRNEMQGDTNFAGCWRVIEIGCGTLCQQLVLLHPESETVVWGPIANYGAQYDGRSNLIVINPKDALKDENAENLSWVETKTYALIHEDARVKRIRDES